MQQKAVSLWWVLIGHIPCVIGPVVSLFIAGAGLFVSKSTDVAILVSFWIVVLIWSPFLRSSKTQRYLSLTIFLASLPLHVLVAALSGSVCTVSLGWDYIVWVVQTRVSL